ncbi:MAG: MASE1 domain-containing protein [Alphaproteobacteria bacterium]|nr:MASE1 domain-containing protein [Alphaproteobacteria bacterium]
MLAYAALSAISGALTNDHLAMSPVWFAAGLVYLAGRMAGRSSLLWVLVGNGIVTLGSISVAGVAGWRAAAIWGVIVGTHIVGAEVARLAYPALVERSPQLQPMRGMVGLVGAALSFGTITGLGAWTAIALYPASTDALQDFSPSIWILSESLGILMMLPLAWAVVVPQRVRRPAGELILSMVALALLAGILFFDDLEAHPEFSPYLALPALVFVAARFDGRVAVLALNGVSAMAIAATYLGHGPFFGNPESTLALQTYLFILAVTVLLLASLIQGWRDLQQTLVEANRSLVHQSQTTSLMNAELQQHARLRDELIARVTHELLTPLTVILGQCESLEAELDGPLTEDQVLRLAVIERRGRDLQGRIHDMLDTSILQAGRLALERIPHEPAALCEAAFAEVRSHAEEVGVELRLSVDPFVSAVRVEPRRFVQVLVNLLDNAIKFSDEGDAVVLSVHGKEEVTFTVQDSGPGIPAEAVPRLFQPFVQLDGGLSRRVGGAGLGLYIVDRMVALHGGRVDVDSAPGEGACFRVVLRDVVRRRQAAVSPAKGASAQLA